MLELVDDGGDALSRRIDSVRSALAAAGALPVEQVERRVAGSVAHLGLVARLIAPYLGAAVLFDAAIDLSLGALWWQDQLGRPFALSVPVTSRRADNPIASTITRLVDAVMADASVSERVLWGNVASAINSAAALIAVNRPDLSARASAVTTELAAELPVRPTESGFGPHFRRNSCCLIYRIALVRGDVQSALNTVCGDCIFRRDTSSD
jgi:ferric iron reductase protein FhuF